ncbi:MAG: tRNA 4-thiouridine(8) synthase ThiI [Eubacteriales bacterium]|nr:tRNA 4-thiouridine(8) synthase ThiI [Eubacteriales bacterium]MDY3332757.1 tRNA uracil 4-sulfurtransferase ThiI [Gallibacter sp.]
MTVDINKDKNIFIVRLGETVLKGKNKSYFEKKIVERIKRLVKRLGDVSVVRKEGLIFVYSDKDIKEDEILKEMGKVFGIASISQAVELDSHVEDIYEEAVKYMLDLMDKKEVKTFKVEVKRADKSFPIKSPQMAKNVGAAVLKGCKVLKVDVNNPDVKLFVNIRQDKTYIYQDKVDGFGGLPLGTNGKGMVLLSGGIDSPVAAFMMAKRGMAIEAIHFHSYPYTSQRAQEKVEALAGRLAVYCSRFNLHVVNLLPVQEEIVRKCPEEQTTILVRRFMMKIAEAVAKENAATMLITGESLGQVASQTSDSIVCTDNAVEIPVMRPLIALDKVDIIEKAKEIETFDISILPFEDCCTVFLPKRPVTRPKLKDILASESKLDVDTLVKNAIDNIEVLTIYPEI